MKTLTNIIFTTLLLVFSQANFAATITLLNNNGDWIQPSNWDLNRVPRNGDVVNIPTGKTVIISSNVYNVVPQQPILNINVHGVLQMSGTGQLNLDCESTVCVFGSGMIPATGCNCNQILFGVGYPSWFGAFSSTVMGGSCVPSPCGTLPVNLISVSAEQENKTVKLSWTAVEEVNLSKYVIERSADGISFENIGTLTANNKLSLSNYQFTDIMPLNGTSYFRLKTIDLDLSFAYSQTISVNTSTASDIHVYPNPSNGNNITIIFSNASESAYFLIKISDNLGNVVYSQVNSLSNGSFSLENLSLSQGVYFLNASDDKVAYSTKLVIQ